jgi:hypothetical protein
VWLHFKLHRVPCLRPLHYVRVIARKSACHDGMRSCCRHERYFEELCSSVEQRELLTDVLVDSAISRIADSDEYFLFAELYRMCVLALSRDASVATNSAVPVHPRLVGIGKGGHKHGAYPPSGVLPCESMPLLAAPLAYLYKQPAAMFRCLRALFCRCASSPFFMRSHASLSLVSFFGWHRSPRPFTSARNMTAR